MINAQDIKIGTCIRMDGKLYFCIDFLHVKPGKGNTFMRVKLKDVVNGYVLERRFNIGEKLEDVRVERRPYQFLYKEGEDYIFMNQETFDQHPIAHDLINGVDFLLEGAVLEVVSDASTETVLYADMPIKVQMKITYTEPGVKGDTATNTLKPATVESGATVRVPLFINEGETIEIDTRDCFFTSSSSFCAATSACLRASTIILSRSCIASRRMRPCSLLAAATNASLSAFSL